MAAPRTTETYSEYDTARRPNKTTQVPEQSSNKLGYNSYGRPSTVTLNSVLLSTTGYDANGEVNTVTYNGNGTALTEIGRDSAGRTNKLVYKKVGVLLAQDEITARYPNGRPPVPHRYRPIPLRRPHRSRQRIRLHLPQRPHQPNRPHRRIPVGSDGPGLPGDHGLYIDYCAANSGVTRGVRMPSCWFRQPKEGSHVIAGLSGCLVICLDIRFQGKSVTPSVGCCGYAVKGAYVGYSSKDNSNAPSCAVTYGGGFVVGGSWFTNLKPTGPGSYAGPKQAGWGWTVFPTTGAAFSGPSCGHTVKP